MNATGGVFSNIIAEELILTKGTRYSDFIGGEKWGVFARNVLAAVNSFTQKEELHNTYNAAGFVHNAGSYYVSFNCIELIWSNNTLRGVIIRGVGVQMSSGTINYVITGVQITSSGQALILDNGSLITLSDTATVIAYLQI
jgi:hypothetical protein